MGIHVVGQLLGILLAELELVAKLAETAGSLDALMEMCAKMPKGQQLLNNALGYVRADDALVDRALASDRGQVALRRRRRREGAPISLRIRRRARVLQPHAKTRRGSVPRLARQRVRDASRDSPPLPRRGASRGASRLARVRGAAVARRDALLDGRPSLVAPLGAAAAAAPLAGWHLGADERHRERARACDHAAAAGPHGGRAEPNPAKDSPITSP